MAEDLLHGAEIGAMIEEMGGHGVAEHVRVGAGDIRCVFECLRDDMIDHAGCDAVTIFEEEEGVGISGSTTPQPPP